MCCVWCRLHPAHSGSSHLSSSAFDLNLSAHIYVATTFFFFSYFIATCPPLHPFLFHLCIFLCLIPSFLSFTPPLPLLSSFFLIPLLSSPCPCFPSFFPLLFSPLLPLRVRVHSILTSSQLVSVKFVLSVVGCACFDLCVVPAASGWVPDGSAVPVPGLADVSRHTHLQTFFPETGSSGGQMAGRVRRRRRTHCSTLPVSVLLSTIDTAVC